ncbi:peptidylprolyl isomerase [Ornithinimicrobium flavum]|uniref:peptidylprolyl isomerase n=1 Tax=Ornithinimicrobium flavum TaxID=1288636 RepID=UPI00106F6A21|nr:peptidylprolyl isomerase [Ornithinimicrobium flavum]
MRRPLVPALALATTLALAACGSGSPMFGADDAPSASGDAPGTEVECAEPPAPPSSPPQFSQDDLPAPHPGDPATVTATLGTSCGDIVVELFADRAPQTVASFVLLAQEGYWDDSPCHRLTTQGIYVLQCGDPTGTGRGNPGYAYGIENAPSDGIYPPGTLAMARTQDPNSNGGQFFVVHETTQLPVDGGGYSIFGQVTEGLDIVEAVAAQGGQGGTPDGAPAQPISILTVDVED